MPSMPPRLRIPAAAIALLGAMLALVAPARAQAPAAQPPRPAPLTLTTTAWPDGGVIPVKYSQAGEQLSPALSWSNVPAGTVSFVLNMIDPDVAIQRGTQTQPHWIVWNIPGTATGLPEGIPAGPQLANGARQISASGLQYRGPGAAATGPMHHYTFELYALDTTIDVTASSNPQLVPAALETRAAVMQAMQGHVLGKAVVVGLFRRPQ
jgi:Raf kinase inhibitor-like YbhB/YbcL family protein